MKFYFMAYNHDDGYCIAEADWPMLPRKGDRVVLHDIITHQADLDAPPGEAPKQQEEPEVFIVDDVTFESCVEYRKNRVNGATSPEINVWLAPEGAAWPGAMRES